MAECLNFVESEKETEMSETNICLPMTLREMLGQSLLNDVAYFRPQIDFN